MQVRLTAAAEQQASTEQQLQAVQASLHQAEASRSFHSLATVQHQSGCLCCLLTPECRCRSAWRLQQSSKPP